MFHWSALASSTVLLTKISCLTGTVRRCIFQWKVRSRILFDQHGCIGKYCIVTAGMCHYWISNVLVWKRMIKRLCFVWMGLTRILILVHNVICDSQRMRWTSMASHYVSIWFAKTWDHHVLRASCMCWRTTIGPKRKLIFKYSSSFAFNYSGVALIWWVGLTPRIGTVVGNIRFIVIRQVRTMLIKGTMRRNRTGLRKLWWRMPKRGLLITLESAKTAEIISWDLRSKVAFVLLGWFVLISISFSVPWRVIGINPAPHWRLGISDFSTVCSEASGKWIVFHFEFCYLQNNNQIREKFVHIYWSANNSLKLSF